MNLSIQGPGSGHFNHDKMEADPDFSTHVSTRDRARVFPALLFFVGLFSLSCGSPPADPRTVIPADSLVYMETRDLGAALRAITENKAFTQLAAGRPSVGAVDGVSVAIAITGFETREQMLTEENAILNFQPRFVAVAETGFWNFQAIRFAENDIGSFVNNAYGGEVVADMADRPEGRFFEWTSPTGQKAYALVSGSLIYFGNDESAIEKCLAVKRGEADSIAKNPKIGDGDRLALGYISAEGVAQIANIAGISLAMQTSEEGEVKSFIARVLPEVLRNSMKDLTWTAAKTERGIEDRIVVTSEGDLAAIFSETIVPAPRGDGANEYILPPNAASVTRYSLRDPQIAWRSVLLSTRRLAGEFNGQLIASFAGSLFEPYGIDDAELFLSAVGPVLHTIRFEADGDRAIVVGEALDLEKIKRSAAEEIDFSKPPESRAAAQIWKSADGETALIVIDKTVIIGEASDAEKFLEWRLNRGPAVESSGAFAEFASSDAAAVTVAADVESAAKIVDIFSERKNANESVRLYYITESRFNQNGMERRTVSDFGMIGAIIANFAKE